MDFRQSVVISRTIALFHFLSRCGMSGFLKVQKTGGGKFRRKDRNRVNTNTKIGEVCAIPALLSPS